MKTFLTSIFCLSALFSFSQAPDLPPKAEPGKCYAKCLIPDDVWKIEEYEVPVYIGDPNDKSVKRKMKRFGSTYFEVVKKPRKAPEDSFEWRVHEERILIQKAGFSEWEEILCANKVTSYTIEQIENALIKEGFLALGNRDNNQLDKGMKVALKEFQREHGLPIGSLDLDTLDALNIDY